MTLRSEQVELPTTPPTTARLLYIATSSEQTTIMYLHSIKSGVLHPDDIERMYGVRYQQAEPSLAASLAAAVKNDQFTLIAAPPSKSAHLYMPYLDAVRDVQPGALDLTECLTREGETRAGHDKSVQALIDSYRFSPPSAPSTEVISLLLVDDVFVGGTTAAAVAKVVEDWLGKSVSVTVACPLRVVPEKSTRAFDFSSMLEETRDSDADQQKLAEVMEQGNLAEDEASSEAADPGNSVAAEAQMDTEAVEMLEPSKKES